MTPAHLSPDELAARNDAIFTDACERLRPGAAAVLRALCPGGSLVLGAGVSTVTARWDTGTRAVVVSAPLSDPGTGFVVSAALAKAIGELATIVAAARTELAR